MKWVIIITAIFATIVSTIFYSPERGFNWPQYIGLILLFIFLSFVLYDAAWQEGRTAGHDKGYQEGVDIGYKWGQYDHRAGKNKFTQHK